MAVPAAAPAPAPTASPAAPAPRASPRRPRRLTPPGPSVAPVSCATSAQLRGRELREGLGERIDEVRELPLVALGELRVVDEALDRRAMGGEGRLELGVPASDLAHE